MFAHYRLGEVMELITLKIDWLGNCPTCDREEHTVSTSEGNKDYLYEDDAVKCWCGQTGVIEVSDGHAWCNWGKKDVSEWDKFNAYYREKYPEYWELLPKANHQACTHHEELFNTWVVSKSKAVPEGFVLVPEDQAKDTERLNFLLGDNRYIRTVVQRDIENEDYEKTGEHYLFTELYWIDGWDYHENTSAQSERGAIDKAMIEAQEQSHESD